MRLFHPTNFHSGSICRGVVVLLRVLEQKVLSSKLYRNTAGIRQEEHPEFKVLHCSSKKSDSKASV